MSYSEQSLINPCCLHTQSRLRRRGIDHIVAIAINHEPMHCVSAEVPSPSRIFLIFFVRKQ
jgi:hypothetical protein